MSERLRAALETIIQLADSINPRENLLYPYRQSIVDIAREALASDDVTGEGTALRDAAKRVLADPKDIDALVALERAVYVPPPADGLDVALLTAALNRLAPDLDRKYGSYRHFAMSLAAAARLTERTGS